MFGRLLNWWRNRDRMIFTFWDGSRKRRGDPMALLRGLQLRAGFDLDAAISVIDSGAGVLPAADFWEQVVDSVDAVRAVFGIPLLDEGGLTEGEMIGLLFDFMLYMDALKKNGNRSLTSPGSSGMGPSGDSLTRGESVSGSIYAGPSNGEPHAFSKHSDQHSGAVPTPAN